MAVADARVVRDGERATAVIALAPPPAAVAYRIRVLARLARPDARSLPDAVRAHIGSGRVRDVDAPPYSRLRNEFP